MLKALTGLRAIQKMFEEAESALVEGIGRPICLPKCGKCCMGFTPAISTIEAIMAVSLLTGTGRLKKVLSLAEGWLVERDGRLTIFEGMPRGALKPKLREEWNSLATSQCPFLAEDKSCLIYFARPLGCRAMGVTCIVGNICQRPLGLGETRSAPLIVDSGPDIRPAVELWKRECKLRDSSWMTYGLAPTLIMKASNPDQLKKLVEDNRIASAKLVGIDIDTSLLWQPQVDDLVRKLIPVTQG